MVNYVCDVTEKIVQADSDTKDVVIGGFSTQLPPEFLNDVSKCISKHSMVIMADFSKRIDNPNLRKAQVIVIVSDAVNQVCFKFSKKIFF